MSSDKQQKLQRYERKDYLETVEFPVEIVGRDGLVREYTFEDAIRLYQRRVTFAPIRYRDSELRQPKWKDRKARITIAALLFRQIWVGNTGWRKGRPRAVWGFCRS